MKVHISPTYSGQDQADGGIRRVVEAQCSYLPDYDIEVVSDPHTADLCAVHGTLIPPQSDRPMVNHNHGLYWREYDWPLWADGANRMIVDRLVSADAVTAPSRWVANAIARGSLIAPEVIYHGVDTDLWTPGDNQGYVLWNKARADAVSDPAAVGKLATRLPSVAFVTTFGADGANIHRTGALPVEAMRGIVAGAGVYLATVRETFGIGTLEALACGVPIVGWDVGGQSEIVTPETGILVPYGDYDALTAAVTRALADPAMRRAARADALARWQWSNRIAQYADLYRRVIAADRAPRPRISVVITTYNLNRYLPEAYASAVDQADEVIVVDDCGEQRAADVLPPDAVVIRPERNLGLSGARNLGASYASGRYLLFLDADDMLAGGAAIELADALDRDRGLHIAYGRLDLIGEDGRGRRPNHWPQAFDWKGQIAHSNQLSYAAMWRRSAFDRTGGYRVRHWRAEDAALWARVTSLGLRARQVTERATLIYRMRGDSKSQQEARQFADRDGDWTSDLPWRIGDGTGPGGAEALKRGERPHPWRVPFTAPGGAPGRKAWPVPHHQHPAVSVIVPVGPGHEHVLIDALDSLIAQDIDRWECIVVNDTGHALTTPGHPWARIVQGDRRGAGAARNLGITHATAPLILCLDADDMLQNGALRALLIRYAAGDAAFVYGDCAVARERMDQPIEVLRAAEFSGVHWLLRAQRGEGLGLPAVTMLAARELLQAVGGFDEAMPAWEDGDLYLKLCAYGATGARVDATILTYRISSGQRREAGEQQVDALRTLLADRYAPYTEAVMAKRRCCGGNGPAIIAAQDALTEPAAPLADPAAAPVADGNVRMAYTGDLVGEHSIRGRPSGRIYRVGNNPFNRHFQADARDVPHLLSMGTFEVVKRPEPVAA